MEKWMSNWAAPGKAKERVLVYGPMGSWKTCGALDIAKKIPGTMYVVDTDNAWGLILERMYPEVENVEVIDASQGWADASAAIEQVYKKAGPEDWVVLDSMSDLWDMCIDHFTELICGKDLPEFLIGWEQRVGQAEAKKTGVQGSLIEQGLYDYVNPTWRKEVVRRTKVSKCHLYMTAQAGPTGNPREDKLTKQLYGDYGFKPRTQKEIGFNAATVLLLDRNKMGKGVMTMVKSWGFDSKEWPREKVYEGLAAAWLFKCQGWRPVKP